MTLTEKAAYIKGLAEGLNLDKESAEGKLIGALIDIVADIAAAQSETDEDLEYLNDYIEEIDEDLGAVEEELYFDEDYDDYDDLNDDEDYDGEDCEYYEMECPSCGEVICFDDSLVMDEITCPACGEKITDIEICDGNCDECDEDCDI